MSACARVALTFLLLAFVLPVAVQPQTADHEVRNLAPVSARSERISGHTAAQLTHARSFWWSDVALNSSSALSPETANRSAQSAAASSPALVLQTFSGPVAENPPDPAIAVGPNHIVATVNAIIVIYDKAGRQLSQAFITDFMTGTQDRTNSAWDTYPVFDPGTGRFFIVCAFGDARTHGGAFLAVSATSDPTGQWHTFLLDNSTQTWVDFPKLDLTQNAVVLTFSEVPTVGSTAKGSCPVLVVGLPGLLSGSANLSITRFASVFGTPGSCSLPFPALSYSPGPTAYLVQLNTPTGTGNSLRLATLDTSAQPAITTATIPVSAFTAASFVPQLNGTSQIDVGPPRIDSAVVRNGMLWCTHTVAGASGAAVRWYELDPVGKTVVQSGAVPGVGNAFMGAIGIAPNGDADMVFTTSSAAQFASAGYAHRASTDPPGAMPVSAIFQPGSAAYGGTRWGDFFTTSVDPSGTSVWGIAEFWGTTNYGTAIVQLAASGASPGPGAAQLGVAVNPLSATISAGSSATFTVSITAQNLSAPIALSCSGLPPGAACSFNPASLSGPGNTKLTITTAASSSALYPIAWPALAGVFAVVGLWPSRRRRFRAALLVISLLALLVACGGAGSGTPPPPPPPPPPQPQTSTVTVTATSGAQTASATLTLTVQ